MLSRFTEYLEEHKLCRKDEQILLAVSGGVDSMVMADLFIEAGYTVTFVHCNFSLRAKESDEDEKLVKNAAKKYNVEFLSRRFETLQYADEHQVSIQIAARRLRYKWFFQLLEEKSGDKIATAHHLNDDLETLILNLVKGTGIKGIAGIPVKKGKVIRPLLFANRDEVEQYARVRKIRWREDASNQSLVYQRNYVRHKLVPEMKAVNPSLLQTFLRTSKRLKESRSIIQQHVDEFISMHQRVEGKDIYFLKKKLSGRNATFLHLLLQRFGINYTNAEEILRKIKDNSSGALFTTKSHRINIDRTYIIISEKEARFKPIEIGEKDKKIAGMFSISRLPAEELRISNKRNKASLDYDKLHFPLKVRQWEKGDKFVPLGMKGQKKLSDFMIDNKIAVNLKDRILVLESRNDIVWVVGQRIDDRYKVTHNTKMIFEIEWLNEKSF